MLKAANVHENELDQNLRSTFNMAYYQQPCDSYFVESHDNREKRIRDELREREKHAKIHTQLAIAEELSQLASYEYRDDILLQMENMEVRHPGG